MKKYLKKIFILCMLVIFPLSLASCMDLGDIQDEEEYGETFEVTFIDSAGGLCTSYSIDEFFNKETTENLDCPISFDSYKYMLIQNTSGGDLAIEDFYFYVTSKIDCTLKYNAYVLKETEIPNAFIDMNENLNKVKEYLEKKKTDSTATLDLPSSNEPKENPVSKQSTHVLANQRNWNEAGLTWNVGNYKTIQLKKDEYIVVQFINNTGIGIDFENTTPEELEQLIEERTKSICEIKITNIIIRVKK